MQANHNFVKFEGTLSPRPRSPMPRYMRVGQIVERFNPSVQTRYRLTADMRQSELAGMRFSYSDTDGVLAVRRDK